MVGPKAGARVAQGGVPSLGPVELGARAHVEVQGAEAVSRPQAEEQHRSVEARGKWLPTSRKVRPQSVRRLMVRGVRSQ